MACQAWACASVGRHSMPDADLDTAEPLTLNPTPMTGADLDTAYGSLREARDFFSRCSAARPKNIVAANKHGCCALHARPRSLSRLNATNQAHHMLLVGTASLRMQPTRGRIASPYWRNCAPFDWRGGGVRLLTGGL